MEEGRAKRREGHLPTLPTRAGSILNKPYLFVWEFVTAEVLAGPQQFRNISQMHKLDA